MGKVMIGTCDLDHQDDAVERSNGLQAARTDP
jgi:hypothetical protein